MDDKMKVADLKRELKSRGLTTTGNKNELLERLQLAVMGGNESDLLADANDLLGDDDDVSLTAEGDAALTQTQPAAATEAKTAETVTSEPPKKKVAINRETALPTA